MSHVDTPSPITHVSLCAGYGGIDLGLKRAIPSLRTIAFSEIEAFACANLVSKMEAGLLDPAPIWTDLKTFPWSEFHGRVDILSGGYPCQPFSAAGKRLGAEDPRHLWPFIAAGIALMRPSCCFFENVEGHISLGLPDVLQDLAGMGYRTTWGIFSASEVGAVHQRKRVFILAYRNDAGRQTGWHNAISSQGRQPYELAACGGDQRGAEELADSQCAGLEGFHYRDTPAVTPKNWRTDLGASGQRDAWPSRPGQRQHDWEPPRVVGNHHGPHAGHGEQRPERPSGDLSGWCGEETPTRRPLEHASHWSNGEQPTEQQRRDSFGGSSEAGGMGHANSPRPQERSRQRGSAIQGANADGGESADRQTQPSLGRDADGLTRRLDDAVLHVSTDNRTDELRLLGNGVVPTTAERAFRVLIGELREEQI